MPKEAKGVKRERNIPPSTTDTGRSKRARQQNGAKGNGQKSKGTVMEWHIDEIFKELPEEDNSVTSLPPEPSSGLSRYAIIILNQGIEIRPHYFFDIWDKCIITDSVVYEN